MKSNSAVLSDLMRSRYPSTARSESLRKKVHGHGVNDADYMTQGNDALGKLVCPCYTYWKAMITRAYSESYRSSRPTYNGVTVCESWLSFMKFREWWTDHHVDGWHLDKDLVSPGSKIYSPSTCVYIPQVINSFTASERRRCSSTAIGTSFYEKMGKYHAHVRNPHTSRLESLGFFVTEKEANNAWKKRKLEIAESMRSDMDAIDKRIHQGVVSIINNAW